jgi:hypothetical protein
MKRFLMFALLWGVALVAAGCGMVSTGETAGEKAGEIARFTVPAGFTPEFSMDVADTLMVGYNHTDGRSHIFLMQVPASSGLTQAQLEQSFSDAMARAQGDQAVETVETEETQVTIGGETVTASIGTGTSSSDNTTYRVLTVPFTGIGGPAVLVYQRPEAEWNQAEVDEFLGSFE